MTSKNIMDLDLYELLGVRVNSDENEIKKAFRKKALDCHPDKNPDDPKAVERFLQLSKGLEILGDVSARAAYDKVLLAKKAAKIRYRELDSKRQKLIDDLERREREAQLKSKQHKTFDERTDEEKLQAEITRLQKEGSKLLQEEQERIAHQILIDSQKYSATTNEWISTENRVKVKWYSEKSDDKNGGYNDTVLRQYLKKYGDINELVIPNDKKGCALIEFSNKEASELAVSFEKGNPENPLTLTFMKKCINGKSSSGSSSREPGLISKHDYETLQMREKRQAAERKRLREQI